MFGHIEMNNLTTIMAKYHEDIKYPKGRCRHCEEVHRNEVVHVIVKKRPPGKSGTVAFGVAPCIS